LNRDERGNASTTHHSISYALPQEIVNSLDRSRIQFNPPGLPEDPVAVAASHFWGYGDYQARWRGLLPHAAMLPAPPLVLRLWWA
jgi:hypothetical protein